MRHIYRLHDWSDHTKQCEYSQLKFTVVNKTRHFCNSFITNHINNFFVKFNYYSLVSSLLILQKRFCISYSSSQIRTHKVILMYRKGLQKTGYIANTAQKQYFQQRNSPTKIKYRPSSNDYYLTLITSSSQTVAYIAKNLQPTYSSQLPVANCTSNMMRLQTTTQLTSCYQLQLRVGNLKYEYRRLGMDQFVQCMCNQRNQCMQPCSCGRKQYHACKTGLTSVNLLIQTLTLELSYPKRLID